MGRYAGITLDAKRRFALPLQFRQELKKASTDDGTYRFYIGYEEDPCLYMHTESQHENYLALLGEVFDDSDPEDREALTTVAGSFIKIQTDAQGRVTIGEDHKAHASLAGKVDLVASADRRFEIWSAQAFEERSSDERKKAAFARLAERRRARTLNNRPRGGSGEGGSGEGDLGVRG